MAIGSAVAVGGIRVGIGTRTTVGDGITVGVGDARTSGFAVGWTAVAVAVEGVKTADDVGLEGCAILVGSCGFAIVEMGVSGGLIS